MGCLLQYIKGETVNKATFCVICTEENEVEVSDNQIICQVCGSPISDGILERDERIFELESLNKKREYEVGLQVTIKETEEILIPVMATSEEEAIELAKNIYEDGDFCYSDFISIGDRESNLQEDTSSWNIRQKEK